MSWVTNLLLYVNARDAEPEGGKRVEVNEFFEQSDKLGLISLDNPALPRGWYGGDKMLEAQIYVGAFNYLDLEGFLEHVRGLAWQKDDSVQVFVKKQEEDVFRIINVVTANGGEEEGGQVILNAA